MTLVLFKVIFITKLLIIIFLQDLVNINEFFRKKNVNVLRLRELFDFVVSPIIARGEEEATLEELNNNAALRLKEGRAVKDDDDEEFFKKVFIPRRLTEVTKFTKL